MKATRDAPRPVWSTRAEELVLFLRGATWIRVAVNYLTPFVVTSIGYLAGCRAEAAHTRSPAQGRPGPAHRVPPMEAEQKTGHDGVEG